MLQAQAEKYGTSDEAAIQSVRLGMSGAVKLITSVARKFIVRMDSAQLLLVSRHIWELAA